MEVWRNVKGFENIYQVSNLGRFKSLPKVVNRKDGTTMTVKGGVVKGYSNGKYITVCMRTGGKGNNVLLHRLVCEAFLPNPNNLKFVNHKDGNTKNNNIGNLEWCTKRENTRHGFLGKQKTSKYTGVHWDKVRGKWFARIEHNGKNVYLGRYDVEEEAHQAYVEYCNKFNLSIKYTSDAK